MSELWESLPDLAALSNPTLWIGLLTLVLLEIVLSIDNLIFIAILSERLPPQQQDRARVIGLSLALFMRLGLLASITWVMSLSAPLFSLFGQGISFRDLVLILGGLFLLVKATMEIHERLEGVPLQRRPHQTEAKIWPIIMQIVVLDAVFSLDSIITAIGMVDEIYVMMAAVVIAVIMMVVASRPLSAFINSHPALVILCLGFLLMIGAVLMADGLGYHIQRGYLYSAIGFSVLIETFNQLAAHNRRRRSEEIPYRQRAADAVLHLLGAVPTANARPAEGPVEMTIAAPESEAVPAFAPTEKAIVRDVLALADRNVQSVMKPRRCVAWLDRWETRDDLLAKLRGNPEREFLVCEGGLDRVVGFAYRDELLACYLCDGPFDWSSAIHAPAALPANCTLLNAVERFRQAPLELALIVDEHGNVIGILTRMDLLEAATGELAGKQQAHLEAEDGALLLDGSMSIYDAQKRLQFMTPPAGCHTMAGLVLTLSNRFPKVGERFEWQGWCFEIAKCSAWRVEQLRAVRSTGRQLELHKDRIERVRSSEAPQRVAAG